MPRLIAALVLLSKLDIVDVIWVAFLHVRLSKVKMIRCEKSESGENE